MRLTWVIGAILSAVPYVGATAQSRWLEIVAGDGTRVSLDTTRVTADSAHWFVWTEWKFRKPQKITVDRKSVSYMRSIDKWEVDCAAQQYKTVAGIEYGMNDEVVESREYPSERVAWTDPIPDSYGETVLRVACRVVTGAYRQDMDAWLLEISQRDSLRRNICGLPDLKATVTSACRAAFDANASPLRAAYLASRLDSILGLRRLADPPRPE